MSNISSVLLLDGRILEKISPPIPLLSGFSSGFLRDDAPLCLYLTVITCPHNGSFSFSREKILTLSGVIFGPFELLLLALPSGGLFSTGENVQVSALSREKLPQTSKLSPASFSPLCNCIFPLGSFLPVPLGYFVSPEGRSALLDSAWNWEYTFC